MIYCLIKGKEARVQHTHPNNRGIITTFMYSGNGCCSPNSFSLEDFESVEEFLKHEYPALDIISDEII